MFYLSAFHHVQVINVGLESVSAAAASWPVTVLICAPACNQMVTPFCYLFCKFIVIMPFLIQKKVWSLSIKMASHFRINSLLMTKSWRRPNRYSLLVLADYIFVQCNLYSAICTVQVTAIRCLFISAEYERRIFWFNRDIFSCFTCITPRPSEAILWISHRISVDFTS